MRNFLLFIWLLLSVALSAQTVSQVRNQSTNPTYIPDGTTAKPPLCFNRSNHSFFGYAGGQWYQLSPAAAYVDPDPDPLNEKIVSVTVDPITNVLRINEAGTFFNVPINSIVAEASISGSGTITVTNVGGVVTISSTDPDEDATNECNTVFSVSGGNLQLGDVCGTLQIAVTDIAPLQVAVNGLHVDGDSIKAGGLLIENTIINANGEAYAVIDTSIGSLSGCLTKRVVGGINQPSVAGLYDNTLNSYEAAGEVYVSEVGNDACSQVVRDEFLTNGAGVKSENRLILGEIQQSVVDVPNGTVNVVAITGNSTKVFSAAPSGTTEIVANGGAGKMQASDSLYLEGGKKVYVVAPDKLYVQPINTGSAIVGDVLTMVGANGETEWRPAGGDICEQLSALPSGTPSGTEKVLYYNAVTIPSGWVGYDFDIPTNFPPCTDATNLYLHLVNLNGVQYYYPPATTNPTTPVVATNTTAIQSFLNTSLVAAGFAANDLIWVVNGDNTVTVWANPTYVPNNSEFWCGTSDPDDYTNKLFPTLPTTHTAPASSCFLGDAPSGGLASARNGLTAVGDTVELGGTLIKPTMVIGNAISSLTIGSVDMPNYVHIGEFSDRVKQFSFDNTGTSEFQLQGGNSFLQSFNTARLQGDIGVYLTTSSTGKLFIQPPNYSSKSVGDILTLLDPLTGEADYTDGNATFWRTDGNIGTDGGTNNFIGTTDAVGLAFRTDNQERMRLQDSGELSIGTTSWLPNCPVNIKGNNTKNIVHFSTDNVLAGYIVEHTPSGNFAGIAATGGNAGALVNATGQFPFTVATGTSTNFTTTTVGTYNSTGFGIGGGFAPTSTLQLQGSYATNALVIAANYTATGTDHTLLCNNGATAITVTLPNPTTCLGREYRVLRYAGSTGTITVTDARGAAASVQDLAGTLGVTTTIAALGSHDDWSVLFKSVTVGATSSWIRID